MHAYNITHFAVRAENVARAKKFYETVFGWQFQEWGPPDFYLIKTGNEQNPGIMGALQKRTESVGTGFNGYECTIGVENLSQTEAKVIHAGGTILMKPMEIPNVGRLFQFADTEGNHVCAMQYDWAVRQ
jgi:predicted enzyme related to lactoylglutathione lyase